MNISIKKMTLVSIFTSLTVMGTFISLPIGPVPITLQSLFVILSGIILGSKLGALSQIVYLSLGLIGLPIFSNFTGGPQAVMMPSFGFIIGFIFSSYIVGLITHSKDTLSRKRIILASLVGTITIYIFGLPYMYYILNIIMEQGLSFGNIFRIGALLFLPGDIAKLLVVSFVSIKLLKVLNKANISLE
ncbi:MAG: biotin transporter BioY [Tissierella sp.]|uniref:biotin transporter BioY n=1 Tax=Tissierella sp. TaxID=41274 RepID=UPI003F9A3761